MYSASPVLGVYAVLVVYWFDDVPVASFPWPDGMVRDVPVGS